MEKGNVANDGAFEGVKNKDLRKQVIDEMFSPLEQLVIVTNVPLCSCPVCRILAVKELLK
jgi:hypothetical protein